MRRDGLAGLRAGGQAPAAPFLPPRAEAPAPMPRLSANLGMLWPDRPLLARVEAAARAGFAAVELQWPGDTPAPALAAACRTEGLRLLSLNAAAGETLGFAALPDRAEAFRDSFLAAADYAREAGAEMVHVLAGCAPDTPGTEAVLLDRVAWAAAEAPDLVLLLEPMNRRDRPGYFYNRPARALALAERIGAANVGVMLDFYHAGMEGLDPLAEARACLPALRHVQIARVPDRCEPDASTAAAALAGLDALGYGGWVGAEYAPAGDTDAGLGWAAGLLERAAGA